MQANQIKPEHQKPALSDYLTIEKLQEKYPDKFTIPQLTWILRKRDMNGLSKTGAVVMVSRKPYIHEPLFTEWFANQKA